MLLCKEDGSLDRIEKSFSSLFQNSTALKPLVNFLCSMRALLYSSLIDSISIVVSVEDLLIIFIY